MKSKNLLLMLLLALCMPWAAIGQETQTLTVHDGTATNNYVPVYGFNVDHYLKCEMVYPASELSAMNGAEISSMKFYASQENVTWGSTNFQVFMTEVTSTSISSFSGPGTVVYEGDLSIADNEMLVTFNTPYTYNGGNLLVGVYNTAKGSYHTSTWQGETVNGASFQGYDKNDLANISGTQCNFLPKTTFTYESCAKPESLTVSDVTSNSATLTWAGGSGSYNVDYKKASDENWTSLLSNTSLTTTSLTDLDAITEYQVRVQSVCDGDEVSLYRSTSFTTPCVAITTFPWNEDFEDYEAGDFADPCWVNEHISGNGSSIFKIYTNTNGTNSTHQLRLPDMASGTLTKLVLPGMALPNSNYQFVIDVYRNDNDDRYVEEGIRVYASTNGEIEGATELAFISRNYTVGDDNLIPAETASGWYTYKLPIGISGTCYIILRGESKYGSSTNMDNFVIKEIVTVNANKIVETVSDPATEMTWDQFVSHWNNDDHFTSTTITLMDDISVSTMVGTGDIPFTGTFDGNGHTITVDLTATEQYTAPFRFINDATILNLKVDGTINDDGNKFCAGFAADCYGNNTFTNCVSDVTINGTIEGDGTHGGFIAVNHGSISSDPLATTIFNGCAFTGKLLGTATNQCGGFCGWSEYYDPNYAQTTFNNCVFAPQEVTMGTTGCATFARRRNANYMTINNCYFMQDFNDGTNNTGQGKQAYSITGKSPVVVAMLGEPTNTYSLSGIDIYSTGIVYDGTIYAGDEETVSLALSGGPEFETDHGTLTVTDETYTLLMEAYDTEISVVCVTPYDLAVNNVTANSAQVTWQGYSDSYSVNVGKKNISTLN
ncbi:MAG: fibronectin type III domain-containing protein, partial [Bacteroidales bacterium]|nr:fibronectin type III domain-containing protein [Bacteroidales bacterium]